MITINTNTTAMVAQNNLNTTQSNMSSSMLKLSTGLRINSAADDAAGMQISNRMETQINGLGVAQRNANDAISMAQTAEGAMTEITDMMNRMRDLSLQSANDSNTTDDRAAMEKEVGALKSEINRIRNTTNFAGTKLLNGDASELTFQVGSNANETISMSVSDLSTTELKGDLGNNYTAVKAKATGVTLDATGAKASADGKLDYLTKDAKGNSVTKSIDIKKDDTIAQITTKIADETGIDASKLDISEGTIKTELHVGLKTGGANSSTELTSLGTVAFVKGAVAQGTVDGISLSNSADAQDAVKVLDGALAQVDAQRADLGAVQNRLESTIDNLGNIETNISASQSRIKDVDFAKETTNMTSQQMMMQAGSTILSQAKSLPQYATQLLG